MAPPTLPDDAVFAAGQAQVSSDLGGEVVILDLDGSRYYGLNEVGAFVWDLLAQPRSVGALQAALLDEYDVDAERCRADLEALLDELITNGLVERRDRAS